MSWSLQIRHGDLAQYGTSLGQVAGGNKLLQDLRCAILEKMGTDDLHPNYGSTLDGGVDDLGRQVPSVIGEQNLDRIALAVRVEIERIARNYQASQLDRAQTDVLTYGKATLTPEEILDTISHIEISQIQDSLVVEVHIRSGSGTTKILNIPLSSPTPVNTVL